MLESATWGLVSSVVLTVFLLNVVLAASVVFFERRNPASTWAWILVFFFIPLFGYFIYLVFGRQGKKERTFRSKSYRDTQLYHQYIHHDKNYTKELEEQKFDIKIGRNIFEHRGYQYIVDLAYLNIAAGSALTNNNYVKVYTEGASKFHDLIQDIRGAKQYVHILYYIIRPDDLGRKIVDELAKKAAEGVEVKLLYDGMGCKACPKDFFTPIEKAGGQATAFLPPFVVRLNYRNHRKLCVIDGQIGYIGGFNIGNEYLGITKRFGNWRDTHLKVCGDVVDQLELRFLMDWDFCAKLKIENIQQYFPEKVKTGNIAMQIVSSGPDTKWDSVHNMYFKMINEAEEKVYIETPYFVPDDSIIVALKVAALSGLDVKIIIPGNPDHPFVYWASLSYLGELMAAGVRCFQYEKGFIHSKTILIDGKVASIGTANFDVRSFRLNFEVNSCIYDRDAAGVFEKQFLEDLLHCTEITQEIYNRRSIFTKIREAVSRLISPIL